MANLFRTAKSGSNWTTAELDACNIAIVPQSKAEFFGTNDLDAASPAKPREEIFDAVGKIAASL